MDNRAGSGLHFSPAGVEVDEKVLTLGTSTRLRVAAGTWRNIAHPAPAVLTCDGMTGDALHDLKGGTDG